MLLAIKSYVQQHPNATAAELGLRFQVQPETLSSMLQILERKGYVKRWSESACTECESSCQACPLQQTQG